MVYNIVLVFGVLQIDLIIYIYIDTYIHIYFFVFFSITVYYRILNIIPCVTQEDLVVYPFYMSLHLLIPNSQSMLLPPFLLLKALMLFSEDCIIHLILPAAGKLESSRVRKRSKEGNEEFQI